MQIMTESETVVDSEMGGTELGSATVEVIDAVKQVENTADGPIYPDERVYDRVTILESGWVRCKGPEDGRGPDDGKVSVDHYPPERVNGIFSVEELE